MILNTSGVIRDSDLKFYFDPSVAGSQFNGSELYDLSGNNHHGSSADGSPSVSSDFGGILVTDGDTDQLKVEHNVCDNLNSNFSVFTFVRYHSLTNSHSYPVLQYVQVGPINGSASISLGERSNKHMAWRYGTSSGVSTNIDIETNRWYSVAYTHDGTKHRMYIDGVLAGTSTLSAQNSTDTKLLLSGWRTPTSGMSSFKENFPGDMGPLLVYNRTLSDEEVLQNFRSISPRYGLLYYDIVTDDLLFNIDSFYPPSYGGSGTVLTDTVKGLTVDFSDADETGYDIDNAPNGWYFSNDPCQYVNQNSSDFEFQYGDSFSVEAVVYVNENTNSGYIVSNRQTDASGVQYSGWALIQQDGKIRTAIGGYPSNSFDWRWADCSTSDFTNYVYQKWSHIVWSNDGTTGGTKLYINGVDRTDNVSDDATPPYTINYDGDFKLGFGADSFDGTSHPFDGNISACRIYDKSLSLAEVNRNFNAVRNYYGL